MQALTARTLRFWGVVAPLYGALLGLAVATLLPWKSPLFSVGLLLYAGLWIGAGVGLWRRARWGWRAGLVAGFVGLALMVVVATGLVMSWAYLHAIYGDFGLGASIGALLFASVALQVLGLVPGLLLRALLRREVRADFGAGARLPTAALALLLLPLPSGLGVRLACDYDLAPALAAEQQTLILTHLRARLEGVAPPALDALAGVPTGPGPLYVTLWQSGEIGARVTGEGADLAAAVASAADALMAHPKLQGKTGVSGRLKVDRVRAVATVPFADHPALGGPVVALSVNAGLDGLQRVGAAGSATLLPDDLVKLQVFGHAPLVPGIREMRFGLDARGVLGRLGLPGARLERLRTEGFVEPWPPKLGAAALPVVRGNPPPDVTGPAGWRQAAVDGGRFVLRQLQPDGRFHYQYLPYKHFHPPTKDAQYSLPRHAGTVYALALLHGLTGDPLFKRGAERAIAWLDGQIPPACGSPDRACVTKGGRKADLGSTALTLVGMLEYRRRTEDARYDATIRRLVAFVMSMQKENGDFYHDYDVPSGAIAREVRSMFYSEEASLALVMAHQALGEPAWLAAAERALDFLTGPKYADFFLGRFIYGADHWTCIAVDEAFDRLPKPGYLDFCLGYTDFIARMQYESEGWDNADFAGHYGFGGFMVPQAPAAAGFTEAVLSTWSLARKHGRDTTALAAQSGAALDALTRDRIRPDNAWMMPRPGFARGGIRRSLVEQEVRIDFTQHAASALIRGAELAGALTPGA